MLTELPPELLLIICTSGLDFAAISALRRCCKDFNGAITVSEDAIFCSICKQQGLVETSSGSSSAVEHVVSIAEQKYHLAEELQSACKAQQSLTGVYDSIESWKDFAQARLRVDMHWRNANCNVQCIACSESVFRFKLDTESRCIIYTSQNGLCTAITMEGDVTWQADVETGYCHIEASNGFLVTHGSRFTAWQRDNLSTPPRLKESERAALARTVLSETTMGPHWKPFAILGEEASASKLRYPYHLSANTWPMRLDRVHLETGAMESCDVTTLCDSPRRGSMLDGAINYVELLDDVALIAGNRSITAWSFKDQDTNTPITQWPPVAPEGRPLGHCRPLHDIHADVNWSAVHHDSKGGPEGGNLVATSIGSEEQDSGTLMYTSNSKLVLEGATYEEYVQQTVVLQADAAIVQLAVENGRACFITRTHSGLLALWLVNLVPFKTLEDFKTKAPAPICLACPLPSVTCPGRLEMTASEVIISGNSVFDLHDIDTSAEDFEDHQAWCFMELSMISEDNAIPHLFTWESLEGEQLHEPYDFGEDYRDQFDDLWTNQLNAIEPELGFAPLGDCFFVYKFDGEEQKPAESDHDSDDDSEDEPLRHFPSRPLREIDQELQSIRSRFAEEDRAMFAAREAW